jgi:hypothetical protein
MADLVTNVGKEYVFDVDQDTDSITLLLYSDATDALTESDDLSAITTEPDTAQTYARQTSAIQTKSINTNFGFDNETDFVFDVSGNSENVDAAGLVANFASSVAGDGGTATDHLIAAAFLTQTRDLSEFDTLTVVAGDLTFVGRNP